MYAVPNNKIVEVPNDADLKAKEIEGNRKFLENMKKIEEEKKEKQKFEVYAVPCNKAFVVSAEKAEEFINLTNSGEDREFVKNCAEEFRKNNLVEDSDFLVVTCNKPFIVDPEKWEEFKKMKPNPELMKKIEEASKKLNIKVEIEEGPVLRKVIKPDKK